jgi:PBSX family phage terminase large subunit
MNGLAPTITALTAPLRFFKRTRTIEDPREGLVMEITKQTEPEQDEPRYEARGAMARLYGCEAEEVLVEGPAGTGKSRGILEYIFQCCEEYPGARILFARKVRKTLADSILVCWEEEVLTPNHECLDGIKRSGRHQPYTFANGSTVTLLGFDDREKIKSTQFDMVYVNEGTEISREDWDYVMSRLRGQAMPFKQGIIDCNPGSPSHWLNKRPKRPRLDKDGKPLVDADGNPVPMMKRFVTRHRNNAAMWDRRKQEWTPYGAQYMARLQNLSGTERARLLLGEWVAQEGAVFEGVFDAARHCIKPPAHIVGGDPTTGKMFASTRSYIVTMDWGFRVAGCMQVWAVDSERRMYRVREVYAKGKLPAWWLHQARCVQRYYANPLFVCDPEDAAEIAAWSRAKLRVKAALKLSGSIVSGIKAIKDRLTPGPLDSRPGKDGRPEPTLYLCKDAVGYYDEKGAFVPGADQALLNDDEAVCTEDEMGLYSYEKDTEGKPIKEKPIDKDNHGCDAMRYAVQEVDGGYVDLPDSALEPYTDPIAQEYL